MEEPLIDVVIPVYNGEKYLQECLDSIIGQSYKNLRILIINDGSTDNSGAIIRKYQDLDPRIEVIEQENHGLGYCRKIALQNLKGDFLAFVDADDYVKCDFIYKLYLPFKESNVDISVSNFLPPFNNLIGNIHTDYIEINDVKAFFESYVIQNQLYHCACNKMYKIAALHEFDVSFEAERYGEDLPFLMKLYSCMSGRKIAIVRDSGYFYRQTENSITHKKDKNRCYGQFKIFEIFYKYIYEQGKEDELAFLLGELLWMFAFEGLTLSIREGASSSELVDFCKYVVQSEEYHFCVKKELLMKSMLRWSHINAPSLLSRCKVIFTSIAIKMKAWKLLQLIFSAKVRKENYEENKN